MREKFLAPLQDQRQRNGFQSLRLWIEMQRHRNRAKAPRVVVPIRSFDGISPGVRWLDLLMPSSPIQ
jgi:hypothetical protein